MKERNSSFERAKVIAVFLVILSHVAYHSGVNVFGTRVNEITTAFYTYMGQVGNGVFVFATCWFISDQLNVKRLLHLILTTMFYSYIFLIGFEVFQSGILSMEMVIKSIFPIAFANNWFITAYILFVLIVPYLYAMIRNIDKKHYFYLVIGFAFFYCVVPSILGSRYFINEMMGFLLVFFIVQYIKKYNITCYLQSRTLKLILMVLLVTLFACLWSLNILGSKISLCYGKTLFWLFHNSVPILLIDIVIFVIVKREPTWSNKIINRISSCSLGIYLIHENKVLVESGFYEWIHELWAKRIPVCMEFLLTAGVVFLFALFIEFLREKILGEAFKKLSDFIAAWILEPWVRKINIKFNLYEK